MHQPINGDQRAAAFAYYLLLAEVAARTIKSPHDRARFESRLARVAETL